MNLRCLLGKPAMGAPLRPGTETALQGRKLFSSEDKQTPSDRAHELIYPMSRRLTVQWSVHLRDRKSVV